MNRAETLIDKAAEICGSRYAMAKRLEVDQAQLSRIVKGKEGLAPGLAARLAAIAGEDPIATALEAVTEREKNEHARDELRRLFKMAQGAAHSVILAIASAALLGLLLAIPNQAEARTKVDSHAKRGYASSWLEKVPFRQVLRMLHSLFGGGAPCPKP